MLPILVLLIASSALAAPGAINIKQLYSNDIGYGENSLIDRAFSGFDRGDIILNALNIGAVLRDLSRQGGNQPYANGQALAYVAEIATGRPGDVCAAANYINKYTNYVATGNAAGVREALGGYIDRLIGKIDNLVGLKTNKESFKFKNGPRGQCAAEGRSYQFEPAWDIILGSASSSQQSLITEEYCVAKRLYCAFSAIGNNIGATVTAAGLPPTVQVFDITTGPLTNFLNALATNSNLGQSAASLKQALASAVSQVSF